MSVDLDPAQLDAIQRVREWYAAWKAHVPGTPQVFKLFGYAGTGKTTLARKIADGRARVLFAAYTGKAALVLTSKGCPASTLHSLIYLPAGEKRRPKIDPKTKEQELDKDGKPVWEEGRAEPSFRLNEDSDVAYCDLLIIDEVSMVDEDLARDVLSFGKPILVLGDPFQLPPVRGGGFFTKGKPDVMLTAVHRHSGGELSQVLSMATRIRSGETYDRLSDRISYNTASEFDQVIVGRNSTRWEINDRIRAALHYPDEIPVPGDKIIVLQNNKDHGVLNGETFRVLKWNKMRSRVDVIDDFGNEREMQVWPKGFSQAGEAELQEMDYRTQKLRVMATFAWAITCHKSQGSQWGSVLVLDESHVFRGNERRWLYTAVTRAVDEVYATTPGGLRSFQAKRRPRRIA